MYIYIYNICIIYIYDLVAVGFSCKAFLGSTARVDRAPLDSSSSTFSAVQSACLSEFNSLCGGGGGGDGGCCCCCSLPVYATFAHKADIVNSSIQQSFVCNYSLSHSQEK